MALILLLTFQLISAASSQFYYPYEQEAEFSNRRQPQNQPPFYYASSQSQRNQMGRMPNQNYPPNDLGQYQRPNDLLMNSERVQNPYRQPINYGISQSPEFQNDISRRTQLEESMIRERMMQESNTTQENGCSSYEYFDTATSWCTSCSIKFPDCLTCDESACNSCYSYAYLSTNGCTRCSNNCKSCNQNGCLECYDGNYLTSNEANDNLCYWCASKYPNCATCDGSACKTCYPQYYLDSTKNCVSCPTPYCWSCDMTNCYSCAQYYYLDNDRTCKQCQTANCVQCTKDACSICQEGYYLATPTKCSKCPDNCYSCNQNYCIACVYGSYLDTDGSCKRCSNKFSRHCDYCNKDTCLSCRWRYTPNSEGVCVKCSDLFEGCTSCDKNKCYGCDDMYYWDPIGNKCSRCNSGCHNCLNSTACWNCINSDFPFPDGTCTCNYPGTYMNSLTSTCEYCSLGCRTCNSLTSCTNCLSPDMINNGDGTCSCQSKYYFDGWNCRSCSEIGCQTCSLEYYQRYSSRLYYYSDDFFCSSCQESYYLLDSLCYPCRTGCAECSDSKSCIRCHDPDNMITDESGGCYCRPGYRFDFNYKVCVPCLFGCAECLSSSTSSSTSYCTSCIISNSCNVCFDSKYMKNNWDGTCSCIGTAVFNQTTLRCDHLIPHCAEYDTSRCSKCDQGYFLYDNSGTLECLSCSESCNSCTPHPGCYLCGKAIEKESSTCTSDNSVGYLTRFQDGNLILDFAYDLPEPLSIKEIIIKSPGTYDTSSWYLTQITSRQYMIVTNLKSSDLPIDVKFKFNRG